MQALGHIWGDNSTLIFLLENDENYAFISIKWIFFWNFAPWHWNWKEVPKKKKNRSQAFLKIMKIEVEPLYIVKQETNFFKLLYSFNSLVKAFEPFHCRKQILNNVAKMSIFQRCIQNPFKHLRSGFSQKKITVENCSVLLPKNPS